MRVVTVTAMYPSSERPAAGTFVRTSVESLRVAGVDVEVFVLSRSVPGPRIVRGLTKYVLALGDVRRRIRLSLPDVVHAHFVYPGLMALLQRRIPVVVTFHGDDLLGTVRRPGSPRRTLASRFLMIPLSRLVGHRAAAVIVQSREMHDRLGRPDAHIIPCEVDLDLFRPHDREEARQALGLDACRPYVLFAASPDIPVKNHPFAVAVVERVRANHPDVELVTVHSESQERLSLFMSAADVLVFPSFQEGSPNVIKQAMACNLPFVSTDVGDVRELSAGTANCAIAPLDIESFSAELNRILSDGGRSDGRERIGWLAPEAVVGRVLEVYRSVGEGAPASVLPSTGTSRPRRRQRRR